MTPHLERFDVLPTMSLEAECTIDRCYSIHILKYIGVRGTRTPFMFGVPPVVYVSVLVHVHVYVAEPSSVTFLPLSADRVPHVSLTC